MRFNFFHLYGFILGIAFVVGFSLVEKKALQLRISEQTYWRVVLWAGVAGLLGARAYHVLTDFYLYQGHLLDAFKIWNGGLSIIGAVIGAILGAFIYNAVYSKQRISLRLAADLSVFGLPIAQAIGRLGNFVNQELYGLPTRLPWAIPIDVAHRMRGYQQFATYHPLFAYEALPLLLFGVWVWLIDRRNKNNSLKIGTGKLFLVYVLFYSALRFLLDFLRIDKTIIPQLGLGVNQVVLLGVFAIASGILLCAARYEKHAQT